ncbi:MAG: L,D-transpeptidase family protein [Candidatus Omnitrophica bacterium]|nr:L,D-transpeptidase family protein [Candidatus Omnitrophota bacterium]
MNKKIIFIVIGSIILLIILGISLKPKETGEKTEVKSISFQEANKLIKDGKYFEARKMLKEEKNAAEDPLAIKKAQNKLEDINMKLLFSPRKDNCSKIYKVKRGDSLSRIAKKFDTTVGLIKKANGLTSNKIIPEQELKVNTCKFSLVVDKSQNILFLKRNGNIIKTYIVATGKQGRTPEGKFIIINKLVKPTWYKTGAVVLPDNPENILGSRWMGFDKAGYGIHGTTEPESLGNQVTLGCIRMRNEEVEELYTIIPTGTEVVIVE